MKPKKTLKSLAELTADSIAAVEEEPQKAKPPPSQVVAEQLRRVPIEDLPHVQNVRGFHDWGINE
jgi:hypothetical protein